MIFSILIDASDNVSNKHMFSGRSIFNAAGMQSKELETTIPTSGFFIL